MSMSRKVATAFMILSLAFTLVGCGGTSGGDEPQTEPEAQETVQEDEQQEEQATEEATPEEPVSSGERLASIAGEVADDVALAANGEGSVEYKSVDALANALINGEVDLAVVTPEVSSALYNATAGSIMAIDAVANEGEAPHAVTVVRLPYFGTNAEDVVAYVAQHQSLVEGTGATFLRGSAMQRELTDAITDAYVEDPSSIGGSLPPDNFYFLG